MKRYFLFGLLILGTIISANGQKLINGGKPKAVKTDGLHQSYCLTLAKAVICKGIDANDDEGKIFIKQNNEKKGEIKADYNSQSSSEDFFAFYGDLDKNNSAELIIVNKIAESNGLGVSYFDINILPDFQTKGFQTPITFQTTEFGANGTFIYDAKTKETLILVTDWNGLDNINKNNSGTYFVGRFFRYQNGLLKPATEKPILARRLLNTFANERNRTFNSPLRPYLWLNSPKAQKLKNDPEFSQKPLTSETGVVEKYEVLKHQRDDETFEVKQIRVKLNSGESKTFIISKSPNYELENDNSAIFPDTYGILPSTISLPKDVSPELVFGNLEGRKVLVTSHLGNEDDSPNRYKVLFYE